MISKSNFFWKRSKNTIKNRPEHHLSFVNEPECQCERQPRPRYKKDHVVNSRNHPCPVLLNSNNGPCRFTFHLSCHYVSSLVLARVQMSDVFTVVSATWSWNKVPELNHSFASTSIDLFVFLDTHMGWDPHQGYNESRLIFIQNKTIILVNF
jgi:hypothetical protein